MPKRTDMNHAVLDALAGYRRRGKKAFAVLIDPDDADDRQCRLVAEAGRQNGVDLFFVGGSLITTDRLARVVKMVKEASGLPVTLFPGSNLHITSEADAIFFLSLISGRNPEFLIGQHVVAAPLLKRSGLEIIPTAYMLVNCGNQTTVSYISNTTPLPYDKPQIAACTALAGEMMGMRLIYLDGGSGAQKPISPKMVGAIRSQVDVPMIVGGGIRDAETAEVLWKAGADVVVVGNAIEEQPGLLTTFTDVAARMNEGVQVA